VLAKLRSFGTKKPAPSTFSIQEALVMSELSVRKNTSHLRVHICKFSPALQQLLEKIEKMPPTAESKMPESESTTKTAETAKQGEEEPRGGVAPEPEPETAATDVCEKSSESPAVMPECSDGSKNENTAFIGE
jgi:hypothetical protein